MVLFSVCKGWRSGALISSMAVSFLAVKSLGFLDGWCASVVCGRRRELSQATREYPAALFEQTIGFHAIAISFGASMALLNKTGVS